MGLIQTIRGWIGMIFKKQAEEDFKVNAVKSPLMDSMVQQCADIYSGKPFWVLGEHKNDGVKTINFAKAICSEVARLATLAIGIQIDGSPRGDWLQEQIDKVYFQIRHWLEFGAAYGTVIIKPNGKSFDMVTPFDFMLTDCDNQDINGIVFRDTYQDGKLYYTRLEFHSFEEEKNGETVERPYYIRNKAYVSKSESNIGDPIDLSKTKWSGMMEESRLLKANGEPLDGPMFGVLRMPAANNIDFNTPLGLPVFVDAIEELRDLDVAYSRNVGEIFDSEKIILADDRLLLESGKNLNSRVPSVKLPHYVKNVFGNAQEEFYQEINPQLNTDVRLTGLNALLSQIGYKCGFSNGYFVFNEKSGMVTATQVEAEDRRTIQLIKDVRDKLESCLDDAIYALSVYADLYGITPPGEYEINYDFGDLTYNYSEDKETWWRYVVQGKVPFWYYLSKFENITEEDAKALEEAARPKEEAGFFQGE